MTPSDTPTCDLYVDISACDCEAPGSKLNDALEVLQPGQVLMAVSRKQALVSDIPAYCQQRSLELVEQGETGGELYFLIRL